MSGISPEVRKWGGYLIFDWIGLGKGNGRVQAYLAHDHLRDADKKMVLHSWESQWTKTRHSPLVTRCIAAANQHRRAIRHPRQRVHRTDGSVTAYNKAKR
jgi:hypothetical protein